jgi:hexosaminidase
MTLLVEVRRFQSFSLLAGLVLIALIAFPAMVHGENLTIIPKPLSIRQSEGHFTISEKTVIVVHPGLPDWRMVANSVREKLRRATGLELPVMADEEDLASCIVINGNTGKKELGEEAYELSVRVDRVMITAQTAHGAYYGTQSLYQLLPPEVEHPAASTGIPWKIPCVEILDKPRFPWRGMHLDVGRHFFPPAFVKRYLDVMAAYKLNTFHWHLTEDQGWRIEIKKYPRLTGIGSQRRETMGDCAPYGGYYTQDEVREVVEYARQRFISVVPEIEMPGHAQAALASYPEFSCSGGPVTVATEWGVFNDVYCAGREGTFEFLKNILEEVTQLFPGPFVHIGGDECPKLRWRNCVQCQKRIKTEGLKDESELQSYFIKRVEKILSAKGKRLIGWDEILEGGLAPGAAVMSWRGTSGGRDAAKAGHDVVMSPGSNCYFDHYQGKFGEPVAIGGYLPIDTVYSYEPVPADLTAEEAKHILGAQGNMWTEWMPDSRQVEYMLLPRMLALSEVVWSREQDRDYHDFALRLEGHYDRLAAMGMNFRVPPPSGAGGRSVIFHDTLVTLSSPVSQGKVYYALGENDTLPSSVYSRPIMVRDDEVLRSQTVLANGRKSNIVTTEFVRADSKINGLDYSYYEGGWDSLPDFKTLTPVRSGRMYDIGLAEIPHREDQFGVRISGFITPGEEGDYRFSLASDDGSKLFIDGREILNNDGMHAVKEVSAPVRLAKGKHALLILYFERWGDQSLSLSIEGPHSGRRRVPPRILSH